MKKDKVVLIESPADALTEMLRTGAKQLITEAVEIEFSNFITECSELLSDGKQSMVRNGYLPSRQIMTGIGQVEVKIPRARDRGARKEKQQFHSSLIPPYMRRTATLDEVLPLLYLKGISEADFVEALAPIFGREAKNLSPGVISGLKAKWMEGYQAWQNTRFDDKRYVYWWVDGVHFSVRSDDNRCVLVVIGVNESGEKELIALSDGFRESTESWSSLLRDLKARGLTAPALVVGDGALGFWSAVLSVFPEAKHQCCWFHKMGNVLDKLPKSQQARAKSMLQEIWMSATRDEAYLAFDVFIAEFDAKYPKATACLAKDKEQLLAFYDFPAEHWAHLRTTNPIESTFATVRNRTYKAKGAFSSKTILLMVFRLMQSAQKRWIRLRGFQHLENVIKGVKFIDGKMEREKTTHNDKRFIDENYQDAA